MGTRRFLVTGGTGFLGAALVHRLVQAGHAIWILDNNTRGSAQRLEGINGRVQLIEADVRDAIAVRNAAKGVDTVVHLAAINGTEFFYSKPELVLDVGVRGMLSVLDACRFHGIDDLVVASSSEVYQSAPSVPTDETVSLSIPDVMNPRYSYGGSKIISELMAINYGRTGFARACVFRPHNVYGPDMGWEHVIPQFTLRAKDAVDSTPLGKVPFEIQGDGSQTRAFVHIDDFTDGLMTVIEKGAHLGLYHVGTQEEMTMAQLAKLVMAWFGREAELVPTEAPRGATPRRCPDIGQLRALGYAPKIKLRDGLSGTIAWYVENAHRRPTAA